MKTSLIRKALLIFSIVAFGIFGHVEESEAQDRGRKTVVKKRRQTRRVARRTTKRVVRRKVAHHRYRSLPRRGAIVVAPSAAQVIAFRNVSYRFHKGVYYRPNAVGKFVVVAAPRGLRIRTLPVGYRRLTVGTATYFYYCGTFYQQRGSEYEVVQAPVGARVESIPEGYTTKDTENGTQYLLDGITYEDIDLEGDTWLEVVEVMED